MSEVTSSCLVVPANTPKATTFSTYYDLMRKKEEILILEKLNFLTFGHDFKDY